MTFGGFPFGFLLKQKMGFCKKKLARPEGCSATDSHAPRDALCALLEPHGSVIPQTKRARDGKEHRFGLESPNLQFGTLSGRGGGGFQQTPPGFCVTPTPPLPSGRPGDQFFQFRDCLSAKLHLLSIQSGCGSKMHSQHGAKSNLRNFPEQHVSGSSLHGARLPARPEISRRIPCGRLALRE